LLTGKCRVADREVLAVCVGSAVVVTGKFPDKPLDPQPFVHKTVASDVETAINPLTGPAMTGKCRGRFEIQTKVCAQIVEFGPKIGQCA
jgi:hypothetical protein